MISSQEGGKTFDQRIIEGKSGAVPALCTSVRGRDDAEDTSEDNQWCVSEEFLRNMSASERADYDVYEARRRMEREKKNEEELFDCYGKLSWKCTVCGTHNPAFHLECQGTLKAKDGSYEAGPCGSGA